MCLQWECTSSDETCWNSFCPPAEKSGREALVTVVIRKLASTFPIIQLVQHVYTHAHMYYCLRSILFRRRMSALLNHELSVSVWPKQMCMQPFGVCHCALQGLPLCDHQGWPLCNLSGFAIMAFRVCHCINYQVLPLNNLSGFAIVHFKVCHCVTYQGLPLCNLSGFALV